MPTVLHIDDMGAFFVDGDGNRIDAQVRAGEAWGFEMTASDVAAIDRPRESCRVYWGSHGCKMERGHDGPHRCDCADEGGFDPETREYYEEPGVFNVGAPPYYGPETNFYGEDATPTEHGES